MRHIITYYYFEGSLKPTILIVDDTLADQIINTGGTIRSESNVETLTDFQNIFSDVLGEISPIAFPINDLSAETSKNAFMSLFPNSYIVENGHNVTANAFNTSFSDLPMYCRTDTTNADSNILFNSTETTCQTPLHLHTDLGSGNKIFIRFRLFVFKEDEVVNDRINITLTSKRREIVVIWNEDTKTVNITAGSITTLTNSTNLFYFNNVYIPDVPPTPTPEDDPYGPGTGGPGYSDSGGGPAGTGGTGATGTGGLHDDTSDPIPIPIPPTDVITSAGLITAYNPSTSQLATFANKLWNGDPTTIGDWFRLLFGGDAFNAIIGIHLLPVSPATSGSVHIKLGNWDTEAEAPKIISQYVQHTFGTIMLPEYWGNCIDYAPYTKIQLALPYIGIVDVDTDDVLGSQNTLTYNIDVYSGAICAMLRCIKGNLSSVIYEWSGSCGVSIPITGADKSAILGTVVAGSAITGAAGAIGGIVGAVAANAALAGTAASSYGTMKGKVQKQGNFSPNSGAMGVMEPYFILTRPVQSVPETWQADKGYPSNISAQLGTLTGYTEVSEINLECSGTEAEKNEIIDLLKKGVLF